MLKAWEKERKREIKIAHTFKGNHQKRERVMFKGVQKYLELGRFWKFHTLAQSWSKCMTCISLDLVFDLATLCDASMPLFHPYLKLHRKPIRM
jgi:hypothetical protein